MTWENYKKNRLGAAERQALDDDIAVMAPIIHLAHLRRQQRVTQKQLAQRLNTSQASIARMESTFTLRNLHRMARGMGLSINISITKDGEPIWPVTA